MDDDEIQMIEQPAGLKVRLFNHQLASVWQMERLERERNIRDGNSVQISTNIGINADITGYGKTASMVALVLRDKMEWDLDRPYEFEMLTSHAAHHIKKIYTDRYTKNNTTLVLCGPSIVHQWVQEFERAPELAVAKVTNTRQANAIDIDEYDVVIVCPSFYNRLVDRFSLTAWKRFIYDEPSNVRVPAMHPIRSGFMWLVTATPGDMYSRHRSCGRSYISQIVCDRQFEYYIRPYLTLANSDEFVKQSFQMPATETVTHICKGKIFRAVYGLVNERISKMIEAGHISGAVQALGGKRTDNIVELVKRNKTIELEEIRSKIKIWTLRNEEEKVTEWTNKEKSVVAQLHELDLRFGKILSEECSICYDKLQKPIMEPSCQNIFCGSCLLLWLKEKGSCPLCRRIIDKSELVYIDSDQKEEKKEAEEEKIYTKEDTIVNIINGKRDGQFIIFSEWDDSFEPIRLALATNDISFVEVKGCDVQRQNKIERFRQREVKVAFLNSKVDSSGINMKETTDIILYHTMDEFVRRQIVGRANRIGRTHPLTVHNLTTV